MDPEKLKIIIVGNSGIGKSALVERFDNNVFNLTSEPTMGVDFRMIDREILGHDYKVMMWDTAGQERYAEIATPYYRDADGILLCFAINEPSSFEGVDFWMERIKHYSDNTTPVILVGTKSDLAKSSKTILPDQIAEKTIEFNCDYKSCSSKSGEGVDEVFNIILEEAVKKHKAYVGKVRKLVSRPNKSSKNTCCI